MNLKSDFYAFMKHPRFEEMNRTEDVSQKLLIATIINGEPCPWDGEPIRKEWNHKGIDCLMVRNRLGAWCGYAGVLKGSPFFGVDYNEMYEVLDFSPHGGLTYAGECRGEICHKKEGGDHVFWFGFDCVHAWDWSPTMPKGANDIYRDVDYVTKQVELLAESLIRAGAQ